MVATWICGLFWSTFPWIVHSTCNLWIRSQHTCFPLVNSLLFPSLFLLLFVIIPISIKTAAYVRVFNSVTVASCKVRYSRSSLLMLAIRVSRASQASGLSHKISSWSNPSNVSHQVRQSQQSTTSSITGLPAQERRLALAMFVMIFTSIITWMPLTVALFFHAFHHPSSIQLLTWSSIATLTCTIHNPLIYITCNKKFRRTFLSHFICHCRPGIIGATVEPLNQANRNSTQNNRPEPRWLFSAPALATINETGSHIALAGSKHEGDSGFLLRSSSSNAAAGKSAQEEGSPLPHSTEGMGDPGFSCLHKTQMAWGSKRKRKKPATEGPTPVPLELPPVHN